MKQIENLNGTASSLKDSACYGWWEKISINKSGLKIYVHKWLHYTAEELKNGDFLVYRNSTNPNFRYPRVVKSSVLVDFDSFLQPQSSLNKKMIVARIDQNGERSQIIYVNSLSPRENMITTAVMNTMGCGNVLDKRLRQKAAELLQETPHSYFFNDTEGNYYWVRK